MEKETEIIIIGNHILELTKLPEAAKRELITFYEFLLFKYGNDQILDDDAKMKLLSALLQEANGSLPENYSFNRDELHER